MKFSEPYAQTHFISMRTSRLSKAAGVVVERSANRHRDTGSHPGGINKASLTMSDAPKMYVKPVASLISHGIIEFNVLSTSAGEQRSHTLPHTLKFSQLRPPKL